MSRSVWIVTHDSRTAAMLAGGAGAIGSSVSAIALGGEAVPGADLTLLAPAVPDGALLEGYAAPIAELLASRGAGVVLFSSDVQSRLLAGLVAARLGRPVRNLAGFEASGDQLVLTRTVYGGLAAVTEKLDDKVAVLVVGPGVFSEPAAEAGVGRTETWSVTPSTPGLTMVETRPKPAQTVNLAAAKRVVGVGRGFAAEADLELARQLAARLGAEVACSRPLAEGVAWLPTERYLGVSGATIRPDLYVAVGISGQIQHMVGVNRSKTIVAINKDKNAPIFAQADYGIVGDLYQVLPALVAAL